MPHHPGHKHEGPVEPPTADHVLITIQDPDRGGGVKATYHIQGGCPFARPNYMHGAHTRWEPKDEMQRLGLRACRNCLKIFEPGLLERLLLECYDGALSNNGPDSDHDVFLRLLAEKGLVVKRPPGWARGTADGETGGKDLEP